MDPILILTGGFIVLALAVLMWTALVTYKFGQIRRELDLLTAELRDVQRVSNRLFLEDHERKLRGREE